MPNHSNVSREVMYPIKPDDECMYCLILGPRPSESFQWYSRCSGRWRCWETDRNARGSAFRKSNHETLVEMELEVISVNGRFRFLRITCSDSLVVDLYDSGNSFRDSNLEVFLTRVLKRDARSTFSGADYFHIVDHVWVLFSLFEELHFKLIWNYVSLLSF